ncbi:hypothetical protein BJV82DRAFT_180886 [Fennellomyces sp. T-0311]|nr:hypothetical protein BJV82DRAFT_180886 [Fennellomyces sp. T-0311]
MRHNKDMKLLVSLNIHLLFALQYTYTMFTLFLQTVYPVPLATFHIAVASPRVVPRSLVAISRTIFRVPLAFVRTLRAMHQILFVSALVLLLASCAIHNCLARTVPSHSKVLLVDRFAFFFALETLLFYSSKGTDRSPGHTVLDAHAHNMIDNVVLTYVPNHLDRRLGFVLSNARVCFHRGCYHSFAAMLVQIWNGAHGDVTTGQTHGN